MKLRISYIYMLCLCFSLFSCNNKGFTGKKDKSQTPETVSPTPNPTNGSSKGTLAGMVFSPYKDTSINMNWNTNIISTNVSGAARGLVDDMKAQNATAITLAFATGECGNETWGGVPGATMASVNAPLLNAGGIDYIISTGGAAGSFTCKTAAGMKTFLDRWNTDHLIGIDFDIEAGQSDDDIKALITRIKDTQDSYPKLRYSLTLATLGNGKAGTSTAQSLESSAVSSFNVKGDSTMAAVQSILGATGASTWPKNLFINLMVMDYGGPSAGVCIVANNLCQMGQSAIQAAYNLHDKWGVPYAQIELTPMIGGNDVQDEHFTLEDVDTIKAFAAQQGLGGIHHWSYDRDIDGAKGYASPTHNSMGTPYAGSYGFLKRFLGGP